MAWTKTKLVAAVAAGVVLATGGTAAVVTLSAKPSPRTVTLSPSVAPLDWRAQFHRTYSLAEGQDVKFVGPPFVPAREAYMRENHLSWELPQQCLTFEWDGAPRWTSSSMNPDLDFVLRLGADLRPHQWRDPAGVLKTKLHGDWVFRKGAPVEAKLQALAGAISERLGREVRFEKRRVQQEVVVARGSFAQVPWGSADVVFATDQPEPPARGPDYSESGTLERFFDDLERAGAGDFDNQTDTPQARLRWSVLLSRQPDRQALLANLARQTSLRFDRETREADVWEVVGAAPDWRRRFDEVYGLEHGQAVKLVDPPFIPQRERFLAESQIGSRPRPDDFAIAMEWVDGRPQWTYAGGNMTVWYVVHSVVGLSPWEIDESVPRDLRLTGDWVTRGGASVDEKLESLATIASKKLGRTVRFEKHTGPREAVVVYGSFAFKPLWAEGGEEVIEFFDTTPPYAAKPEVRTTTLDVMWRALQHRLERRVFDESGDPQRTVRWRDYMYTADREALLRNLAKQTSLRFNREKRVMDYWVMVGGR